MLQIIFSALAMFLLVLGLIELARLITLAVYKTKDDDNIMLFVMLGKHSDDVEFLLRSAIAKSRWMGLDYKRIVCVDCGMKEESRKICELIIKDYPLIELYNLSEFDTALKR